MIVGKLEPNNNNKPLMAHRGLNVKMSGLCLQLDMKMTPCPPLFFH